MLGTTIVGFSSDRPAVADVRVRRAISAAVAEVAAGRRADRARAPPAGAGWPAASGDARPRLQPGLAADDGRGGGAPRRCRDIRAGRGSAGSGWSPPPAPRSRPRRWSRRSACLGVKARIDFSEPGRHPLGAGLRRVGVHVVRRLPRPGGVLPGAGRRPDGSDRERRRDVRAPRRGARVPRPRRAAAPLLGRRPPGRGRRGADAADRLLPRDAPSPPVGAGRLGQRAHAASARPRPSSSGRGTRPPAARV